MTELLNKYLARNENWEKLCDRVSGIMMYQDQREELRDLLVEKKFIPNSPTLVNAGRGGGRNLMACHLIKVENSITGIMQATAQCADIFKSGGGVGLDFDALGPQGTSLAYSTGGIASGPVSFMQIPNAAARAIKEGGLRRAAMMATLSAKHPDAELFIKAKSIDGNLENFNISLTYPAGPDSAVDIFRQHCLAAWKNGEPGIVFLDRINADNPVRHLYGDIKSVNACSELPLYPFGSCVLGHVVLPNVIRQLGDYTELQRVARLGVRFLDRVIDVNHYPLPEIAQQARKLRRIGLGIMGWDTLLRREGIPFASLDALQLADEIGRTWHFAAKDASWELARELGGYMEGQERNVARTTIAPTGHTAELAGVSKSIYQDNYGEHLNLSIEKHLNHVAVWQKYVDSAISYTICFPNDAPASIVEKIFRGAYGRKLRAMAVYRDGSRKNQPCSIDGCNL